MSRSRTQRNFISLPSFRRTITLFLQAGLLVTIVNATHFRGGTAWWQPATSVSPTIQQIHFEFRLNWRISFNSGRLCSNEMIQNKVVNTGFGNWKSNEGDLFPADIVCVDFYETEDWMIGSGHVLLNLTNNEPFNIWYTGRCWIDNLIYPVCEWNISTLVDVGIRSDTKLPNSSPRSASSPVIKMQVGCPETIAIPTADPDVNDVVKCRFGVTNEECGEVCQKYPYFSIHEETCQLTYNGGGRDTMVTVALVIEDYPPDTITIDRGGNLATKTRTEPLSFVSLQFIVILETSRYPCNAKPTFEGDTPPSNQVISTISGNPLNITVSVQPSYDTENITDVVIVSMVGVSRTALVKDENNFFTVQLSWTPTTDQIGTNILCFSGVDTIPRTSELRCITITVGGATSPCNINTGGCSDTCQVIGYSYNCLCPRACWTLGANGRTCKPNLSVQCNENTMDITVEACSVSSNTLSLGTSAPGPQPIATECLVKSDDRFHNFSFGFSQCQMRVQEDFWTIVYSNTVRLFADDAPDAETQNPNSPITRGAWFYAPVSCTFQKHGNLTTSFLPVDREVDLLSVPGMGSFTFFLDFYNSSEFSNAIGPYDYPLKFTVNSAVYFGLRAVGGGTDMQLFTVNCLAYPSANIDDATTSYTMIGNGCLLDSTLIQYTASSSMENHFSIQAFKFRDNFPNSTGPTVVNIQCSVMVCVLNNPITRCSQGCVTDSITTRRRKRDAPIFRSSFEHNRFKRQSQEINEDDPGNTNDPNVTQSPVQQVSSSGNIQILIDVSIPDPPATVPPPGKDPVTDSPTSFVVIVSAAVGGVSLLLLVCIIGFIVYHNKVTRQRNNVVPLDHPHHGPAYVRDIYLPNLSVGPGSPSGETKDMDGSTQDNYIWARRVISGPPSHIMRLSQHKNPW